MRLLSCQDRLVTRLHLFKHINLAAELCFLQLLAVICKSYEVIDRPGAAIALATLKAFGIAAEENKRYVVDRNKLQKKRQKHGEKIIQKEELFKLVDSIFKDGRKNATMTMVEAKREYYCQATFEKHNVVVREPSGLYLSCNGRKWDLCKCN